jgi:predicted dehydrogenase
MPFSVTLAPHGQSPVTPAEAELPAAPSPVENFVHVIQGEAEPLAPAEHGIALARVMEAAYESARSGRTVRLPE